MNRQKEHEHVIDAVKVRKSQLFLQREYYDINVKLHLVYYTQYLPLP